MPVNRNEIFYELFGIEGNDRLLFPEGIKDNFIASEQYSLLDIIESGEKMIERYKKAFNREEVFGLCSFLCAHVARHNLLVNENAFSEKFLDSYTWKKNVKKLEESQKSLIEDLMNEARVDDQYYKDVELQNSRAASQKLNEIKKKIKELKKISRSKGYLKKSEQISELLKQLSQETTSTPKNFVKYIDKNLKLSAENKNGYLFLHFVPKNTLFYGNDSHVLLIKENGNNNFAFYDPNLGAVFGLTKEQLCKTVTQVFSKYTKDSKFYKHQLSNFVRSRLPFVVAVCLVSFFTAIAIMVTFAITNFTMILLMTLSAVLLVCLPLIHYLSKISKSELKTPCQEYTKLHEISEESIKNRPIFDSIELLGIPNASEISKLSKDVENLEKELYSKKSLQEVNISMPQDHIKHTS